MLKAALSYADAGWPVFPCKRDKKPLTPHGVKDATCGRGRITAWWTKWPGASIGLATGEVAGVWVLDVDRPKKPGAPDGFDTLANLEAKYGKLPATLTQETGGGGRQYFFKYPSGVKIGNSASKIGPGIDVRGEGGYVILPPSGHPSGNSYRWLDESSVAEAPEWMVRLVADEPKDSPPVRTTGISTRYGDAALARELVELAAAPEGQRNDALNRAAFNLGQLIGGGELDRVQTEAALSGTAQSIGLCNREIPRTLASGIESGMKFPRGAPVDKSRIELFPTAPEGAVENAEPDAWAYARSLFPRIPYPWDVWPSALAEGFRQMGRAFATSPEPIPGAACAIVASLLGSTVSVSPKSSWKEPLIFWFGDIRPSGSGKTPAPRALCKVLYEAQRKADEDYRAAYAFWELAKPKDRGPQPERARGYFMTGLTLEGVRVDHSGHGGAVAILDEVSALISMQNEYKKDGSDREAWLCLHDGNPARIVRAKETKTIMNSRLSIFGGIQPGVWRKVFNGKDGVYLEDGTSFRMLLTYGGSAFYPQNAETWDADYRERWETLLASVMKWADQQVGTQTQVLRLSEDAQGLFFDWRNDLYGHLPHLPGQLKGFIPKAIGYALRLAGVLHCVHRFENGGFPSDMLTAEDMERGIKAVTFYLGQTVDASCALVSKEAVHVEDMTPQVRHLAEVLEDLRGEVDGGHLAIGFICERFNETRPHGVDAVKNPHTLGAMLRHAGLTIPDRKINANGRRCVRCLQWDEKTENFSKKMSDLSALSTNGSIARFAGADIENDMSAMSAEEVNEQTYSRHAQTSSKHSLHPQSGINTEKADKSDNSDIFSKEKSENKIDKEALSERQAIQSEGESYEW